MKTYRAERVLSIIIASILCLSACGKDSQKRNNAEIALENKRQERATAAEASKNDTVAPNFSCTMEKASYEVDDMIDYDRLKLSLKAVDNVDGDLTPNIEQVSSTVEEHQEGEYKVTYEVSDAAGNVATFELPVIITSKYAKDEKARLNNCVKAYNRLTEVLKAPSSLSIRNINTNKSGNIVVLNYSAQNSFGAYLSGRVAYFSSDDSIADLDGEELPANFKIGEYTYEYDDIKEFSDYYHSND